MKRHAAVRGPEAPLVGLVPERRSLVLRVALPLAALILAGLVGSVLFMQWAARHQDVLTSQHELAAIEAALHGRVQLLEALLANAPPSAPVQPRQGEPAVAGESLHALLPAGLTRAGVDGVVLVGRDGQVAGAIGRGGQMIQAARAADMLGPVRHDITEMARIMPFVSGIVLWQGMPSLMVAFAQNVGDGGRPSGRTLPRPILIYLEQFDAVFLHAIARQAASRPLQLGAPADHQAALPLLSLSGRQLTSLVWTPARPGAALLRAILPAVLAIFAILALSCAAVVWFARHAASLIRASELRALLDPLTGLPNRFLLEDRLQRVLLAMERSGDRLTLLYLDLDGFKAVNDTLGHSAGDELLRQAAGRLRSLVREMDTVARVGGDEFIIFQPGDCNAATVHQICIRLIDGLSRPFVVEGRTVTIGVSIGAACAPTDGTVVSLLVRRADEAMYRAKRAGRGRYHRWSGRLREADPDLVVEGRSALP